jgi:hypothetical protein
MKSKPWDWFFHPRGNVCLVAPCDKCGKMCRDTRAESAMSKKKWGQQISIPPRTNGFFLDLIGVCQECRNKRVCSCCGKDGTNKNIRIRNDVYGWNRVSKDDYATASKSLLCMSCWNKIRPIVKKQEESEICFSLIRTINKELKNGNQDNRRIA